MPDQSSAADEHDILAEITAPLANLPDDAVPMAADVDFPVVLRGYDRDAVDAYVRQTSQLVAELQATRSPEAAVRRALERVGEQIAGILQRAHDTSGQITAQSRREAEDRLELARHEALQITAAAEQRLKDLDADTDRIWSERMRIVEDARQLARDLLALADSAADQFPAAQDDSAEEADAVRPAPGAITDSTDSVETEVRADPKRSAQVPMDVDPDLDPDATAASAPFEPHEPDEPDEGTGRPAPPGA